MISLDDNNKMVSFDVISLFTKVPMEDAMTAIRDKSNNDDALDERTTMTTEEICKLTKLCLVST